MVFIFLKYKSIVLFAKFRKINDFKEEKDKFLVKNCREE